MDELSQFLRARYDEQERAVEDDALPSGEAAWVLADLDSKRRILDEHSDPFSSTCPTCLNSVEELEIPKAGQLTVRLMRPSPCLTVRLLALPYADRPDYRGEWKP